jgi:uncharacterized membrane protein
MDNNTNPETPSVAELVQQALEERAEARRTNEANDRKYFTNMGFAILTTVISTVVLWVVSYGVTYLAEIKRHDEDRASIMTTLVADVGALSKELTRQGERNDEQYRELRAKYEELNSKVIEIRTTLNDRGIPVQAKEKP